MLKGEGALIHSTQPILVDIPPYASSINTQQVLVSIEKNQNKDINMVQTKPKIVLVPYPAQGHVTPMLNLASAMLRHGFQPTLVTPEFIHRRLTANSPDGTLSGVHIVSIPDNLDISDGGIGAPDFFSIQKSMEEVMPLHFERLLHNLDENGGVVCVVIDLVASWAIEVANRCGIPAAGFWPAMLATYYLVSSIPEMIHNGLISAETGSLQSQGKVSFLPGQPTLSSEFLPWLIGTPAARKGRFKFWTRALDRSRSLRWLLVNSFPEESGNINCTNNNNKMQNDSINIFSVRHLNRHLACKNKTLSFWEEDTTCLQWLDKQKPDSVIYISFGSWVSPIGELKVKTLANTLELSGKPFIWVLGANWRQGLPEGYLERTSKQGKVVTWAPQVQVLEHKAVGFYLTHCGWNSTLEAIQSRKRMLCYPVAGDQFLNCYFIVNVWGIGARIEGFGREEIEEGLRKLSEDGGVEGRLLRLCERSMGEEASGRVMDNLGAFVDDLNLQTLESPLSP